MKLRPIKTRRDYEAKHYPIPDPDPIDFLRHVMEARALARKDLEPYIGSRARVAESCGLRLALTCAAHAVTLRACRR